MRVEQLEYAGTVRPAAAVFFDQFLGSDGVGGVKAWFIMEGGHPPFPAFGIASQKNILFQCGVFA